VKNVTTGDMSEQNTQRDRQVKVPPEVHQDIKTLAFEEGQKMREVITTAYEFYQKHGNKVMRDE